jgi:tetratricopeptide (TPR) repeat protein
MNRAMAVCLVMASSGMPARHAIAAGQARPASPVVAVPPQPASRPELEPDDLPGPPLETVAALAGVELPAIPRFDRPDLDGKLRPANTATTATAPALAVATEVPLRKVVDPRVVNASIRDLNLCTSALTAQHGDLAIAACRGAIEVWDGNHRAWYAWASAHMARREWAQAMRAIERAVALRPDLGMYQLYQGIALYEAEREQARKAHGKPRGGVIDPAAPRLEAARVALVQATRLAPELWRAHYYLGSVLLDLRDARPAAEQLTAALKLNPGYPSAYLALTELYRRWGYPEQALAVATLGAARVAPEDAADLWSQAAMALEAMADRSRAIEAFGKAIALRPGDASLRLYRGWLYVLHGDLAAARLDLDEVMRSPDPGAATTQALAKRILAHLASGRLPPGVAPTCSGVKACTVVAVPDDGLRDLDLEWMARR